MCGYVGKKNGALHAVKIMRPWHDVRHFYYAGTITYGI
ncbi:hypothetical protein LTSEBAI_2871 [Salmonella enterica subsp. enterica serovar Baildon str. R6-199]|nr:hypothetical protein LTSEBAI_2871 [Salmonella enterica subsp. enterica serovar Baildon str. R6-199]